MKIQELLPERSLIVSCQADAGTPTNSTEMIVAFAQSAEIGGAGGLRLNSAAHVAAVKAQTRLPVIAIQKHYPENQQVLITGDHTKIPALAHAGAEIIAFDATERPRPSSLVQIVSSIHEAGALALADIQDETDIDRALEIGVDAIATTLSVWKLPEYVPDIQLIEAIVQRCELPVIAEGNFWQPADLRRAYEAGAYAVVVGSAITRPWRITEYYVRHTQ